MLGTKESRATKQEGIAMKLWILFSIANEYDQPYANLEGWWAEKPSFDILAKVMETSDEDSINKILDGCAKRIGNADYRLEEVKEGPYKSKGGLYE